jgi:threonine/homoserine/homoserine lactone efflux protein
LPKLKTHHLVELILKAVVTGLILSIMIGPAFFVLLETSITKGIRAALAFDLGILISDLIYILIAYLFFQEVAALTQGENEGLLKIIGGLLFLTYGSIYFFKKPSMSVNGKFSNDLVQTRDYLMLFIKGLVLNLTNPMVIFYWFSVLTLGAKSKYDDSIPVPMFIYIFILLGVFFTIDFLKIMGAKKLRPFVTVNVLRSLNRFIGAVLFLFGVVLLAQGIISKM